jgi:hypothetical protein
MENLKFKNDCDYPLIQTVEWMLGYSTTAPNGWRFSNWAKSRRRLASPLSHYLGEIERFSLDRGYSIDIPDLPQDDPKQQLLQMVQERNHADELAYAAMERGSITGAAYWGFRPDSERYYRLYLYDQTEVIPYPDESGIKGYMVQTKHSKGYSRWGFTDQAYIEYFDSKNPQSPWAEKEQTPHPYGFVPMVRVLNKVNDHSFKGVPSFDWVAVEMAIEICSQVLSSAANYTYFGGPMLVSPDRESTLKELLSRSQVLTGKMATELQDVGLLAMPAMPANHKEFIDGLARNFADHLRISWVPDAPPGDTSSLTLRLLYSKTVNSAERIGARYLGGFKELMEKILIAGAYDSLIVGVTPTNPETFKLLGTFKNDLFPKTPLEKQQILAVVEQLQGLGVSTEQALREYYTELTPDEIQELLIGA